MAHQQAENTLIAAAVAGDRMVMGQLLLNHVRSLSQRIEARLPQSAATLVSAEVVLQDTFVAALQDIRRFDPQLNQALSIWLWTIAQHQLLITLHRLQIQKPGGKRRQVRIGAGHADSILDLVEQLSDSHSRPSRRAVGKEAVLAVRVGLASMPSQKAVQLRHLDGRSGCRNGRRGGDSPLATIPLPVPGGILE